jgi:hypothetical protein
MTNEWPLSFFYIRENSKIYLEFIQVVDKVCSYFLNLNFLKFHHHIKLIF